MQLHGPQEQDLIDEFRVLEARLPFEGARVLDLGCGAAEKTLQIAERTGVVEIVAAEVDEIQHAKNLARAVSEKVVFARFGAEAIEAADRSFDIVLMFKSLHHVPVAFMEQALAELHRVLRPAGLAYISEPVFAGAYNEIIRLFHDESVVRRRAFETVIKAVETGLFTLEEQYFFRNIVAMDGFSDFEQTVLEATHTRHDLSPALRQRVRERFESLRGEEGFVFEVPNRVDLLRKAG